MDAYRDWGFIHHNICVKQNLKYTLCEGGNIIRLTDEEIEGIVTKHRIEGEPCDYSFVDEGAKAQLKKVVDEFEACECYKIIDGKYVWNPQKFRGFWQALLEEIK